jgi:hypothetical protein
MDRAADSRFRQAMQPFHEVPLRRGISTCGCRPKSCCTWPSGCLAYPFRDSALEKSSTPSRSPWNSRCAKPPGSTTGSGSIPCADLRSIGLSMALFPGARPVANLVVPAGKLRPVGIHTLMTILLGLGSGPSRRCFRHVVAEPSARKAVSIDSDQTPAKMRISAVSAMTFRFSVGSAAFSLLRISQRSHDRWLQSFHPRW